MSKTLNQQEIFEGFRASLEPEVGRLLTLARQAQDAVVPLPAKNEFGESVIVKDNNEMRNIRDMYFAMSQAIRVQLDRATESRLEKQFGFSFAQNKFI